MKNFDFCRQLEAVCNNATVALFILDAQHRCTYMNPAGASLTGFSFDEVENRLLHNLVHHVHPDGSPFPLEECPIGHAIFAMESAQGEEVFVHKKGHFYHVAYSITPICEEGQVIGSILELQDITDQSRQRRMLDRRSEQLQWLADTSISVTRAGTLQTVLDEITQAAQKIIGTHQAVTSLSRSSGWNQSISSVAVSEKYAQWRDYSVPPDGSGIYALVCERGAPMRVTQRELEAHSRWRGFGTESKRHPPMRGWLAVPLTGRDQRNLGLIQLSDKCDGGDFDAADEAMLVQLAQLAAAAIEQSLAEEELFASGQRLEQLAESMPNLVWQADPQGFVRYVNGQYRRFAGCSRDDEGVWTWSAALHPDDVERSLAAWSHAMAHATRYEIEHRAKMANGEYRWLLSRAVPIYVDGAVSQWVGTATDIHDLKLAQTELHEADRRKEEFLAMLAHELRNPLAAIRNVAQLLGSSVDEATAQRLVEVLQRQSDTLTTLVDDLLDVSRITRGVIPLERQLVDLLGVANRAVESVKPLLDHKAHRLRTALPDGPLLVMGDAVRLEQVVINLLTNAAKYTDPGGEIELALRIEAGAAEISIRDTGIGMTPDELARVFELFHQAEIGLARSEGGLGIGLTIAKNLVEMHDGRIEASSPGRGLGATFGVRLPQAPAAATSAGALTEARSVVSRSLHILLVEDNDDIAETLGLLLEELGHKVAVHRNGEGALAAVATATPDLILLDIGLPGMDGYALARRLRQREATRTTPLLALTGYGQPSDRERASLAGFDDHLVKPVDFAHLERLIARYGGASPEPA